MNGIAAPKVQLLFDVSPETKARLDKLRNLSQAESYAEVVANALRLYEAVVHEVSEGGKKFFTKNAQGEFVPFKMFK